MSFLRTLARTTPRRCRSLATAATAKADAPVAKSTCAPETILTGLNYLKGQEPVLAKPDEEYPDWLWTILKPKELPYDGPGGKAERLERRKQNKAKLREHNFMLTQ